MSRFDKAYYVVVEGPYEGLPHFFDILIIGRPGMIEYQMMPAWK